MAIVSVEEITRARERTIDPQWRRTYKRAWRVVTDDPFTGALAVSSSLPIVFGQTYRQTDGSGSVTEFDNFAYALKCTTHVDPAANDDLSWIAEVEYGPWDPTQFPENPLQQPLKISFGSNRFEKPVDVDIDGNAVVNSAGDYFDPPPTIDDSRPTIRIIRNESTYNPQYALLWKDTTNLDEFFGFPPGTVKMAVPLGDLEFNPVCGFYFVVTYEFDVKPEGWDLEILDQGLRVLGGGGQVQALDENSQPVSSPVLLDGAGAQLATGGTPAFITYKVYQRSYFSTLGLNPFGAPGQ